MNPEFATWGDSLWNVWVLLFSGLETPPKRRSAASSRWLCSSSASAWPDYSRRAWHLLDRTIHAEEDVSQLRNGRSPGPVQLAPRGLEWIREVHAKIIQEKRPVVIIHDSPDDIDLPDKQESPPSTTSTS